MTANEVRRRIGAALPPALCRELAKLEKLRPGSVDEFCVGFATSADQYVQLLAELNVLGAQGAGKLNDALAAIAAVRGKAVR